MIRVEDSEDLEVVFPNLDFNVHGALQLPRHKSEGGTRITKLSSDLREFIIRFLGTLDEAVGTDPDSWFLLYDSEKQCAHLPLACGWTFSKYCKASLRKPIVFRKYKKSEELPHIGAKGCGCASTMSLNPDLFIHDTPMIAISRFSGHVVVGCLHDIKGAARQKHTFSIMEGDLREEKSPHVVRSPQHLTPTLTTPSLHLSAVEEREAASETPVPPTSITPLSMFPSIQSRTETSEEVPDSVQPQPQPQPQPQSHHLEPQPDKHYVSEPQPEVQMATSSRPVTPGGSDSATAPNPSFQWASNPMDPTMSLDQMLSRFARSPFSQSLPPMHNPRLPPPTVMEHLRAVEIWVPQWALQLW